MAESRLNVLITTNIPSPYFVDYADELQNYCDVTVLYELRHAKDRVPEWQRQKGFRHNAIFLDAKYISDETGLSLKPLKYIKDRKYDRIIIANALTPTGIMECLYCRLHRIEYILQSEGGFQGTGKGVKEKLKKFLMEKARYYLTGMGGDDDYFLLYGGKKDELRPYPFTSMHKNEIDAEMFAPSEKKLLRNELGIKEPFIVVSVGRIIPCKGYDILIQALQQTQTDFGLYIIGGQIPEEYWKLVKEENKGRIHCVEFCKADDVRKYYHAADCFVLATRGDTWGLVINESMAAGLPVITTKKCVAGCCLIEDDVNGYLVEADNVEELAQAICKLHHDEATRFLMGRNNLEKISKYTIENMALQIFNALVRN